MQNLQSKLQQALQTVYDPDFPVLDIYNLGLIYNINVDQKTKQIEIVMTFTTPACPMAEYLIASVKKTILLVVPDYEVNVTISFEPARSPQMIKDPDLQRMFE